MTLTNPTYVEAVVQEKHHEIYPDLTPDEYKHVNCKNCDYERKLVVPTERHLRFYQITMETVSRSGYKSGVREMREAVPPSAANAVSSQIEESDKHIFAVDIDIPARCIPSGTEGHSHLYIDHEMTWRQYKRVLKAMMKAGIIEKGYYNASIARKATVLRVPWKKKSPGDGRRGILPF